MTAIPFSWPLFFERFSKSEAPTIDDDRERTTFKPREILVCQACRHEITRNEQRCAVKGSHEHRFFNPYGIVFHIGCFGDAPGCSQEGDASSEFSWFKGYQWRIAVCSGCGQHLGWSFSQNEGQFFGLVLNRLERIVAKAGDRQG